jgi:gamma-glutamylcyclotransferase (GGCT)/AIG2-like uncharacterized protein YtfP
MLVVHSPTKEHPMTDRLPFFVYGTLRRDCGNHGWALDGRTSSERPATMPGAVMHDNGGFPYVTLDPTGDTVLGEVMVVPDEHYADVLSDLDGLEGYHPDRADNHYDRIIVTVTLADGSTMRAYTYVVAPRYAARLSLLPVISDGDWKQHAATRRERRYARI